jgi:16S rRNA (guanine1207-N2)-methyltransferase
VGPAAGDHYFTPAPAAASRRSSVDLVLPDLSLTLLTDRGVFSPDAIDPGTKLLLLDGARPDANATGALLDLGCGYGPIACALALRAPAARVWAVEVNERARGLCAANAAAAGVENVTVAAPEDVPTEVTFAGIWSNPPIRIGKAALHELLTQWLDRLAPDGRAHLVVHKHLGADSLAGWLDGEGWSVERRASRAGYRLLDVGRR